MPGRIQTGRTVNRAELAGFFGISLPTVDSWLRKGCPIVERGSKGREAKFDSAAVIAWRVKSAVADATSGLGDGVDKVSKDEADRRRAVANAITAEVEADEAIRSVLSRFDVESSYADFAQALRSSLSTTGAKIANRTAAMTNPAQIRDFCQAEINRAFDAAEADLKERWAGDLRDDDVGDDGED